MNWTEPTGWRNFDGAGLTKYKLFYAIDYEGEKPVIEFEFEFWMAVFPFVSSMSM